MTKVLDDLRAVADVDLLEMVLDFTLSRPFVLFFPSAFRALIPCCMFADQRHTCTHHCQDQ
jgi:hypothetical protein